MPVCRMSKTIRTHSSLVVMAPLPSLRSLCNENDMLAEGEETTLYSDELVRSRSALYARRFRPWAFLLAGWVLFFSFGSGIELWSNILLGTLVLGTLVTPVLHFMGSTKFQAELAALTP